jgi:CubicO group peptidase (beta-lactamase class C family)
MVSHAFEPNQPHELTADDFSSFTEKIMGDELVRFGIPGAVVIAVKDGRVLFSEGFGFADLAGHIPMNPDATLVNVASITKLFWGIGVMQLVEQGKLDLDRDVSEYLDFRIPTPPGGVPVTLRRLLTHRAGFAEQAKNMGYEGAAPAPPVHSFADRLPIRIYPEGDVPAYSNYGAELSASIVERITGEPFERYGAEHILAPLGMLHSSFDDPLPASLAPLMARAYRNVDPPDAVEEHFPMHLLVASAADMGRFMLALLDGGRMDGGKILEPETLAQMIAPQVTTPAGNVGLAFYEYLVGEVRFIGKDGDNYFHSILMLKPDERFGIFVAYNGQGGEGRPIDELLMALADRYFSSSSSVTGTPSLHGSASPMARAQGGVFQDTRRSEASLFKVDALLRQIRISVTPQGRIGVALAGAFWMPPVVGREIAPSVYLLPRGAFLPQGIRIALETTRSGRELALAAGVLAFERIPWYESAALVVPLISISALVLGLTLVLWPFASIVRRLRHRPLGRTPADTVYFVLLRAFLGVDVLVLAALIAFLRIGPDHLTDASDPRLAALYALAWLAVVGAPFAVWVAIRFWRERAGGLWLRIHQSGLAAAALAMAWFFVHWHVAGTTLKF